MDTMSWLGTGYEVAVTNEIRVACSGDAGPDHRKLTVGQAQEGYAQMVAEIREMDEVLAEMERFDPDEEAESIREIERRMAVA